MDEVACFMDWDLEAIVRGCSSSSEAPAAATINMHDPNFSHFCYEQDDDEILCSFPEFSETTKVQLDDLEELYKPFYPVLHPLSTHTIVTSTLSIPKEPQDQFKVLKASENKVILQDLQVPAVSKCKRSKNKNNKVMKQVTASEGVCDAWAWRKYGQKPIKGSPYPRSYYRCSSSKGCLARKQVERSHLDPAVFLVTYTAEHNHPHPTRRNSLAGSTRKNNFIVAPPRTPLVVQSIEDEVVMMTSSVQQSNKGLKKEEDFFELLDEVEGAELGDGWFSSTELEEFIGLDQQLALDGSMHAS